MVNMPLRVPDAVGVNAMLTVQPVFGARVVLHVFAEIVKSPVTDGICSVAMMTPVFEIVMFCAGLAAPTLMAGNVTETGFNMMAPGIAPMPLNCAVVWPPATLP